MQRLLLPLLCLPLLLVPVSVQAAAELALVGQPPQVIAEVYLQDGIAFLALDDLLPALGLSGHWDSVRHTYAMRTPRGTATLFPGGHYLNLGDSFLPISQPARFIDGRLRVPEDFVTGPLANLLGSRVYYRNLQPPAVAQVEGSSLDRLFAFLLQKKEARRGTALRGVALDPGHGGQDPGSLGGGLKEKDLTLALARDLEKQLKMQLGIPVYLSRNADYQLSVEQRLQAAAHPEVDVLLQLHVQAAFSPTAAGIMLFVRPVEERDGEVLAAAGGDSMRLAHALEQALRQAGLPVTGIVAAPLLPLGRGDLPTVLVEAGYLSNPADRERLADPAARQTLTAALFAGLRAFGQEPMEEHRAN